MPNGAVIPIVAGQPIQSGIPINAVQVGTTIPVVANSGSPLVYPASGTASVPIAVLPPSAIQPTIQPNGQYPYYYNGQMQRIYPQYPTQQLVPFPQPMIPAGQMMQSGQMIQPTQIVQPGQMIHGAQMMPNGQMIPGPAFVQITTPPQQPIQALQPVQPTVPFVPRVKKVLSFKDPETKESLVFDKPVETKPVDIVVATPEPKVDVVLTKSEVPVESKIESKVESTVESETLQSQKTDILPGIADTKENIAERPSAINDSGSESEEDLPDTEDSKSDNTKKQYSSPYTIFDLLKLKPVNCPRPANLPQVKDVTDDIITVNQEYESAVKQTKVNYYNQPGGNSGGNRNFNQDYSRGKHAHKGSKSSIPTPTISNLPQLQKAAARWTPGMVGNTGSTLGETAKKIKGILNRLNTNFFDILSKELMELINANVTNIDQLSEVVDMLFVTALAQPGFGPVYAEACVLLNSSFESIPSADVDENGATIKTTFKKILLNKCQYEFEEMGNAARSLAADTSLTADERHLARSKAKSRELGNIKFIGELFKRSMVTEKVIHIRAIEGLFSLNLADPAHEEELEALCKLFINCGVNLDTEKARLRIDSYFDRIKVVGANPSISNRMKFMIKDLVELRESNWKARTSPASTPPSSDPNTKFNYPQQQQQQQNQYYSNRQFGNQNPRSTYSTDQQNPSQRNSIMQSNRQQQTSYRSNSVVGNIGNDSRFAKNKSSNEVAPSFNKVPYTIKTRSDSITSPAQADSNPSTPLVSSRFLISETFMDDNEVFITNVKDAISEYTTSASFDEFCLCVNSINSPLKWELVIMQLLLINGEFSDQERSSTIKLAQTLFKFKNFDSKVVNQGLAIAFTFMEEIWMDSPRLTIYIGQLLAKLVIDQFIQLSSIYSNLSLIPEPKLIQALLGDVLKNVLILDVSNVYLSQLQSYPKNLLIDSSSNGIESFLNSYMLSKLK